MKVATGCVLTVEGHEGCLKVFKITSDACVLMHELLFCVLAVTSSQSKHVLFNLVSVGGQKQDVDPAEEEEHIYLKGVGLFGV